MKSTFLLLWLLFAYSVCAEAPPAYVRPAGTVVVERGIFRAGDEAGRVAEQTTLTLAPAPVEYIEDEPLKLSTELPQGHSKGTRLKACNARDVNAYGSLMEGSLVICREKGGDRLREGEDYVLEHGWASVALGPKSQVTAEDTVYASYAVAKLRVDLVQVSAEGVATLKTGVPHISSPVPPEADAGCIPMAHILRNYGESGVAEQDIFPIAETAEEAETASTPGRIPKTLAKLQAGEPVTIVCLGDSVTAGGNASVPEKRYVDVFAAGLRERFPKAKIDVQNISAGGSSSVQWLYPEKYPYKGLKGEENPARFERVVAAKPDLVTIEFVNDAPLPPAQVEERYSEILQRLGSQTEVILITPHFTMWSMMGFTEMRGKEKRPYVLALREFAEKHRVGLADASARWEHLWKEGLPYLTLLNNTINHPDDRGHRLFAEELWKCFR